MAHTVMAYIVVAYIVMAYMLGLGRMSDAEWDIIMLVHVKGACNVRP